MIAPFPKPGGPPAVTSARPGANMVPLGRSLRSLADRMLPDIIGDEARSSEDLALEEFIEAHVRYADAIRLASLSSPHAVKAWAAERLPSLGISYGFSNRAPQESIKANLDQQASLRMVEFADDLTMVTRFCRQIEELSIEVNNHSHGLEFRFIFKGKHLDRTFSQLEANCVDELLRTHSREHSLRNRIFCAEDKIEAQSIALRKRVRLGLSPMR
ncbi:hypothetical protein [Pelagicoccus sp. SDUM812003]|uniref:hypothetical protein n=1 Tax=Pelagicoccus sp. SDUM812003 TaxID=3041267 RepID=UPI00280C7200|nr:hypothetical protein [Pelagicoccus sp. SDUM812003]MDQ8204542.1 hypothetical protein [Pelagicoccus sp. SDUM812003]